MIMTVAFFAVMSGADARSKKSNKVNNKYASLVMDADTGMILSQRYADKSLHPASLTKMMTLLLTFEALDRRQISKNTRVRVSALAAKQVPSKLGLPAGSSIKVEDAIYALVTKSANDVAVALGEKLGGSQPRFAAMMTARARTIGMRKTRFKNANGLHHPAQVSTARDMAKLARYMLKRYPHYYRYFSTRSFTYKGKTYRNHNRLLKSYQGMDGFKTGYVNASGFNLVASAQRNGRRLIGVVFGGRSSKTRNDHMAEILDAGFSKVRKARLVPPKQPPIPQSKPGTKVASAPKMNPAPAAPKKEVVAEVIEELALEDLEPFDSTKENVQKVASSMAAPKNFTSLSSFGTPTKITTHEKPGSSNNFQPDYTALGKALKEGRFGEAIGEGDADASETRRLETGLIAVAVHKGEYRPSAAPATAVEKSLRHVGHAMVSQMAKKSASSKDNGSTEVEIVSAASSPTNLPHPRDVVGKWSIQIGAFKSRVDTDEALNKARKKLPKDLMKASPMAVPIRTKEGLVFRARLGGLNQNEAQDACNYFSECLTIAPVAQAVSVLN
jgi:D-alanyl-D-alanine carboxypeptidase